MGTSTVRMIKAFETTGNQSVEVRRGSDAM